MVGENKVVLEIGCGFGAVSMELMHRGCKVYGVEINPQRALVAAQYCEKVVCGNIEEINTLAFDEQYFDSILLGDILEHLVHPELILNRLGKYLRPSGRIVVSVPNIAHWSVRLDLLGGKFDYQSEGLLDRTHLHFFTFRNINRMIQECGYRVLSWNVSQGITTIDFGKGKLRPWFLRPLSHRLQGKEGYEGVLHYLTQKVPSILAFQFIFDLEKQENWSLRS
jgi:SAM-dependent methyltransferase